jgi:hypothetical protein
MTTTTNPMLTMVLIPCVECGSTAATVQTDRKILGKRDGACCSPSLPLEKVCWFCGVGTTDPFRLGRHWFCCQACAADFAE